jgi:hypothetical protein
MAHTFSESDRGKETVRGCLYGAGWGAFAGWLFSLR